VVLIDDIFTDRRRPKIKKNDHKKCSLSQEVIDKFGRYPQRNKLLGRENTPEEEEFLNDTPDHYKW